MSEYQDGHSDSNFNLSRDVWPFVLHTPPSSPPSSCVPLSILKLASVSRQLTQIRGKSRTSAIRAAGKDLLPLPLLLCFFFFGARTSVERLSCTCNAGCALSGSSVSRMLRCAWCALNTLGRSIEANRWVCRSYPNPFIPCEPSHSPLRSLYLLIRGSERIFSRET